MLFCYVCGLFKVAVIAQQIYARYVRGLDPATRDSPGSIRWSPRSGLGAVRAIDTGTYLTGCIDREDHDEHERST